MPPLGLVSELTSVLVPPKNSRQIDEDIVTACHHRDQFSATKATAHGAQVVGNLSDYRNCQLTQDGIAAAKKFVARADRVGHARTALRIPKAACVNGHRDAEPLRDSAIEPGLGRARGV